jgi:hypothetical protein
MEHLRQGATSALSCSELELRPFPGRFAVLVPNSRLIDVHRTYQQCSLPPQVAEAGGIDWTFTRRLRIESRNDIMLHN